MTNYLKRFWTVAVSLAGIVGLYLGAAQVKLLLAFWLVIGLSAVIALFWTGGKTLLEVLTRVRNYPRLLERAAQLQTEVEALTGAIEATKEESRTAAEAAIAEGRAQMLGAILSSTSEPPAISILGNHKGTFVLIAKYEHSRPEPQARFHVISSETGEVKGSVEVVHVDDSRRSVYLRCVDPQSPEFWQHLRSRVDYDASPPIGVELARYELSDASTSDRSFNSLVRASSLGVQG
ncbi:hypothetical protein [Micromonospora sp. MH33]|uniref:hypothetical protein n=1 Tax=Micromonospora sp. MH33 TaxID=1945509 RepID=UPI0011B1DEBB|nr:hypothetical protein [Micromonospora sp. MH33]